MDTMTTAARRGFDDLPSPRGLPIDIDSVGTADGRPPRELLQLAMAPVGLSMRLRERA